MTKLPKGIKNLPKDVEQHLNPVSDKLKKQRVKASANWIKKKQSEGYTLLHLLISPETRAELSLIKSDERIETDKAVIEFLVEFYNSNKGLKDQDQFQRIQELEKENANYKKVIDKILKTEE
jgi:hypothetical protein